MGDVMLAITRRFNTVCVGPFTLQSILIAKVGETARVGSPGEQQHKSLLSLDDLDLSPL